MLQVLRLLLGLKNEMYATDSDPLYETDSDPLYEMYFEYALFLIQNSRRESLIDKRCCTFTLLAAGPWLR